MKKTIHYKNHTILIDGITAKVFDSNISDSTHVYKTRLTDASECLKSLKAFINLRIDQKERDKSINIYA